MLPELFSRGCHELLREPPVHVLLEREHRFGLRTIAVDDDGQRLVELAERVLHDRRTDPARERFGADAGQPFRE